MHHAAVAVAQVKGIAFSELDNLATCQVVNVRLEIYEKKQWTVRLPVTVKFV